MHVARVIGFKMSKSVEVVSARQSCSGQRMEHRNVSFDKWGEVSLIPPALSS